MRTVTIVVPAGYATGEEFAEDCGFEIVKPLKTPWDAYHNRGYEPVEKRAKEIYDAFEYTGAPNTTKPPWQGGNSTMEDEARICARRELRDAGHIPGNQ